jgi:hypothetical protein
MSRNRFNQFSSDYDVDFPSIPNGWRDTSWGNDMCPSYEVIGKPLVVWIDAADPERRECGGKRYVVVIVEETEDRSVVDTLIETDDFAEVVAAVAAY